MKVQLEKSYPIPAPAQAAWDFLQRIEAVAECMPGAKITERAGDNRYKGTVTVKVGPATLSFRGELEARDIDPASRALRLVGKGTDTTGTSGASMDLVARVEEAGGGTCNLVGKSEVSMSGKAAAFGGRMAGAVADQIVDRFVANFAARVVETSALPSTGLGETSVAREPQPLSGLALAWAAFRNWLRELFSRAR